MTTTINNAINLSNWEEFFPEKNIRLAQRDALNFVNNNWDKKNIILQMPTGSGKSAIAMTIARTLASKGFTSDYHSYITTTSIELQDQYIKSYGHLGLKKLYSSVNFDCNNQRVIMNCKEGKQVSKQNPKYKCLNCPYDLSKAEFIASSYGIMNLQYYLFESNYAKVLPSRGLMIYDEAHNVGDYVKNFVTFIIYEFSTNRYGLKLISPNNGNLYNIEKLKSWLQSKLLVSVNDFLRKKEREMSEWVGSQESKEYIKLIGDIEESESQLTKIQYLFNELNNEDWIAERMTDKVNITPITPSKFMQENLLNKNNKNIFMSATLFNKDFIMKEYDLDPEETTYFTTPSSFPVKNRPIYVLPTGKIEYNNLKKSMKPFAIMVKEIFDGHKDERGIIFVSSYSQAKELIDQVGGNRIISHLSSKDKPAMLKLHEKSKDSVIVSPSSHEGLDLKGDLSRFQIILKMPFLSLGSESVKKRAELYPDWYAYCAVLSLIQSCGRSIRNETDFASTYILDSDFVWFHKKYNHFFPNYWEDSIINI